MTHIQRLPTASPFSPTCWRLFVAWEWVNWSMDLWEENLSSSIQETNSTPETPCYDFRENLEIQSATMATISIILSPGL